MTRIQWGIVPAGYEDGVDKGVLFINGVGLPWDGLVSVYEKDAGTTNTEIYFDGRRYAIAKETENFAATISAFTYPGAFEQCLGISNYNGGEWDNQYRAIFGFSYRVMTESGYKIHLVYNATAEVSGRNHKTKADSPELGLFEWTIWTVPMPVVGAAPTAHLVIDSSQVTPSALIALESVLYGSSSVNPSMPTIAQVRTIFELNSVLKIVDNGDGSWSATGPAGIVDMIDADTFEINSDGAQWIDADSYKLSNW